jgi:anti-anti-sigma factor
LSEHEFQVETVERDGAICYRMSGVLGDTVHCHDFNERFIEALPSLPGRIVLNLESLENLYSAGIGIVANCYTKAKQEDKVLVIAGASKLITRTLTITGIMPLVPAFATEDEAVATQLG